MISRSEAPNRLALSPTPVPRNKLLNQLIQSSFDSSQQHLIDSHSNTTTDSSNTRSSNNSSSFSTQDETQLTNINEITQFITRTMPLPRKPRQPHASFEINNKNENDQHNVTSLSSHHYNHHHYMNSPNNFERFLITPGLSIISSTSTSTMPFQSTLKPIKQLKRPEQPPPPPPIIKQDLLIDTLSCLSHNILTKTTNTYYDDDDNEQQSQTVSSALEAANCVLPNYQIGFERLLTRLNNNNDSNNNTIKNKKTTENIYGQPKFKLNDQNKNIFNLTSLISSLCLFFICILCISLFQNHVHHFYKKFLNYSNSNTSTTLNKNNRSSISSNNSELVYLTAGSNLVKQTVLFCNGPYLSYQINNLVCLPFSLCLVIIFSFYNKRSSCLITRCGGKLQRPGLLPSFNPFQRRNRLLVAALFCIIANEIFKMIESSMFDAAKPSPFNSTSDLLLSILSKHQHQQQQQQLLQEHQESSDLFRVGFGIEPLFQSITTTLSQQQQQQQQQYHLKTSTSNRLLLIPSVLRYSKPKLPPRLKPFDFTTTTRSTTSQLLMSNDELIVSGLVNGYRTAKNKSNQMVQSFNQSLENSSSQTLFQVSMSLYQNEYVQKAMNTLFKNRDFKWTAIIVDKLETLVFMMFEVLVIGMRYYPLLGIMDSDSIVCLSLASLYMWSDTLYNIAITGLCEGLKLNVSFDFLKQIKRIFGAGFLVFGSSGMSNSSTSNSFIDSQLLFSTGRIVYSVAKSLPHFFSLSYVTIRFTCTVMFMIYERLIKSNHLIVKHRHFNLIYSRKLEQKETNSTNFDYRYVRYLFTQTNRSIGKLNATNWFVTLSKRNKIKNRLLNLNEQEQGKEHFRYSTRIVCTYTVCFTLVYYLTCSLIFYGCVFIDMIYFPWIYKASIIVSTLLSSIICFVQLSLSMKQFRLHLRSLYAGTSDRYISAKRLFSNKKIATSSFNYAGYAVTYTCWGYIFMFVLSTFLTFQMATLFCFDSSSLISLFLLVIAVPFVMSMLVIRLVNKLLSSMAAKFCFLQKKSRVLAVKNLKSYSLFLYFKFFYDCFTSMAFCLWRVIKSICLSVLFMPRLDYSFMGRGMERMDPAYMSYIGYLHWEAHHTNSIVIAFCHLLKNIDKNCTKEDMKRNRIVMRWQMAYLMIKNNRLISYRKRETFTQK